jgi:CAAX prenyl protease-like protein
MNQFHHLLRSPDRARFVPYLLFVLPIVLAGHLGAGSAYWVYLGRTLLGAALIWFIWPRVKEMRFAFSWEAVAAGFLVFVVWVGLDPYYPGTFELFDKVGLGFLSGGDRPPPWNPFTQFGDGNLLAWSFVFVRIAGSSLVVPALEEVFFRSFFYRWIARPDFEALPLNHFAWKPFVLTAVMFGFIHNEWLAGILCGFAYQWLVLRKSRLGDAMTAHAITNFLLGIYVVWKGAWHFW